MDNKIEVIKAWLGTGSINIFGLPFGGKDTQGMRLADKFGGVMISSGDILRHDHGNQRVQELMAAGEIIPSNLFAEIVVPYFLRDELKGKPLILSEVGRVSPEQIAVEQAAQASFHPQKAVILLNLPDEEVWQRFEASQSLGDRGDRADDSRDVLQTRLNSYHDKVTPVIEYYKSKQQLIEIDGTKAKDEVEEEIINRLNEMATRR